MKWEDKIEFAALSDVGMRRSNNQDAYATVLAPTREQWQNRGHVFLVADGMGAHAVGELASKLAADTIPHAYHKMRQLASGEALAKAFHDANTAIHNRGSANRDFQGMGTTSTVLTLTADGVLIAHVGDSRAYRIRNGSIRQLSFDHSLLWEIVRQRHLTLEQARGLVPANVITRSLGPEPEVKVDIEGPHPTEPGDTYVLCSDGLSGQVEDPEIGLLAGNLAPSDACRMLVELANLAGGSDNITVVAVRVGDPAHDHASGDVQTAQDRARSWRTASACCLLAGLAILGGTLALWMRGLPGFQITEALGLLLLVIGILGWVDARRRTDTPEAAAQPEGYREAECSLTPRALERWATRLEKIRERAIQHAWNMDWSAFYAHRNAAEASARSGELRRALAEYGDVVHLLAAAQRAHQEERKQLLGGT